MRDQGRHPVPQKEWKSVLRLVICGILQEPVESVSLAIQVPDHPEDHVEALAYRVY